MSTENATLPEPTVEHVAQAMERMTAAIMIAIDPNGGSKDALVVIGSLGAAIGTVALATGMPTESLDRAMDIARGIINGSLMTHAKGYVSADGKPQAAASEGQSA